MTVCMAGSSFALSSGEYVYTPQGRFLITGDNVASSDFSNFEGWTVISANEGTAIEAIFNQVANGYAEGKYSIQANNSADTEGIYFKFDPVKAGGGSYVVSYKMKSANETTSTRVKTVAVKTNLVKVEGNAGVKGQETTAPVFGGDSAVVVCNKAENLSTEWTTYYAAIVPEEAPHAYYISFSGMSADIQIADLQIAPAQQYADLRQRDAMLEKFNTYVNMYAWDANLLAEYGVPETMGALNAIGDETPQSVLDETLETAKAVLDGFLADNLDDFLAGGANRDSYFDTWRTKLQGQKTMGVWTCLPSGRGYWEGAGQDGADMGHYQNGGTWANGSPTAPMGVYTQMEFDPGSYVFAIDSRAAVREPKSKDWNNDDGMRPAYGVAYIVKINEGAEPDTLKSVVKDLDPSIYTTFFVNVKVTETATYEIGLKAYCKEAFQTMKNGSVAYVKNASIYAKTENKYTKVQLNYEADVREQITTGRNELTKAAENLANAENLWGRNELTACTDSVEKKIAKYELLTQDEIIATFDVDYYNKANSTKNAGEGLLVFEVYNEAVRDIIAANKRFIAVNDTLNSIQVAIESAEATKALRVYDAATGKDALEAAINTAKGVQTEMKAADYSEENAAKIVAAIEALNAAVETFKTTVPAEALTTIVDIDFENAAVLDETSQLYTITGAAGTMEFSNFATDVNDSYPYQQGYWSNGMQLWKGYVRVGNGTGTVVFDPTVDGSMGTNILKVNCDFFLQGLSGRFVGFYLQDDAETNIAGFYANYYDGKIDASSNLPIELGNLKYGSGGSYANTAPQGAEDATSTVCAKNSFEVILDFGEKSMYATTTSDKGTFTTAKQYFEGTVPTRFVLKSNYVNNDRRVWFDNLKIQRIAAGATTPMENGIREIANPDQVVKAPTKVLKNGRIIINGKYGINGVIVK